MAVMGGTFANQSPGVGGSFHMDNRELMEVAWSFEGAPKIVQSETRKAMTLAVSDTRENIRERAPHGETGKIRSGLETRILQTNALRRDVNAVGAAPGITGEVRIPDAKVPYAKWVNNGRGPIRPVIKKWLRFRWHGRIVFTKYVRPKRGVFFMERGLADSKANIDRAFERAADRIADYLAKRSRR